MPRYLIDNNAVFHNTIVDYWKYETERVEEASRTIPDRFQQTLEKESQRAERSGDKLKERIEDTFLNGFGIIWSDDQRRVFKAFLQTTLPLLYGDSWNSEKPRVLREWALKRFNPYALVNMARRNGKTFSTAGAAAAFFLCVPELKTAIFSTCKRTSQMMLTAIQEMLERAFEKGTHANRQDFQLVTKNTETICYIGPDGTKRLLGSFPGSVRVSRLRAECVCIICVLGRSGKKIVWPFIPKVSQKKEKKRCESLCCYCYLGAPRWLVSPRQRLRRRKRDARRTARRAPRVCIFRPTV